MNAALKFSSLRAHQFVQEQVELALRPHGLVFDLARGFWTRSLPSGIEHIVTSELEVGSDGRLTGRPVDPLCYGAGKVERTRVLAQKLGFELAEATFYSDSITDLPLLEVVGTPVAVSPDRRLLRVAKQRGWRIEWWTAK